MNSVFALNELEIMLMSKKAKGCHKYKYNVNSQKTL